MTGTHQSMLSLSLPLPSNTSMSTLSMSLSARPSTAKEGATAVCYLGTGEAKSTSNLCKHVRICCGVETVAAADETQNYGATFDLIKQC